MPNFLCSKCTVLKITFMVLMLGTGAASQAAAQENVSSTTPTQQPSPESTPAKKEKNDQQDLSDLSLEDLMKIKVHSVYGASKFLQKVTEAPASVSIITAEDIKRYGYTTLAAAIRSVRGFYVNNDRVTSELGARGFARPGDNNTRVLLLVDGHRMSDNIYNSALISSGFPIDVDLIERIEIIRGPSSSLYGTNAFFGVINVITKHGADVDGFEVSTQRASFDTYRGRVSFGKQFNSGLDLIVSATLADSKGPAKLYFKEFDDPATNNGVAENVDGVNLSRFFGNISWRGFSLQGVYSNRQKQIPTAAYGMAFNDPGSNVDETRGYLDLKYNKTLNQNLEFMGRVYYDDYYLNSNSVRLYPTANGAIRVNGKFISEGVWWGAEGTVTANFSDRYKLTAGTEFRNNLHQDDKAYDEDPFVEYFNDHHRSREWAGYVEGQFRATKNVLFNAGVRYDASQVFGGTTNPRFALVYNPLQKTTVKFLYGQAFRAPTMYESHVHSVPGPHAILKPETIKTAEVVVEQYLGDRVRLAASAFSYGIRNLITRDTDPQTGIQTFMNVGRVRSNGFESEIEVKSNPGVQGLFSYAYQKSRDNETGATLTNSPAHMLKLNLNTPLGLKHTFGGLELQYLSDRKTLANRTAEDFLITNFTVLSEQIKNRFDLSFSIYNLFDTKYGNPASADHRQDMIPQDGRTFGVKFTYRFSRR